MQSEKKKELIRSLKFLLFSISAGAIQILSFTLLNELLHLPYWVSYLIALVLSVIWNFTLNRRFTFRAANNVPVAMLKVAAYYAVFTPLSTLLEDGLTTGLGWNEYIANKPRKRKKRCEAAFFLVFYSFFMTACTSSSTGSVPSRVRTGQGSCCCHRSWRARLRKGGTPSS